LYNDFATKLLFAVLSWDKLSSAVDVLQRCSHKTVRSVNKKCRHWPFLLNRVYQHNQTSTTGWYVNILQTRTRSVCKHYTSNSSVLL